MKKRKRNNSFFSFFKPYTKKFPRRIGLTLSQKVLLAIGLLLFGVGLWLRIAIPASLSFTGEIEDHAISQYSNNPVKVFIPSISLALPIQQTKILNGKWEVFENGVSHLTTSADPGSYGNIILYGHNTAHNLGNLKNVKIGEPITLVDKKGEVFTYKVYSIKTVNADDLPYLNEFDSETITIYTCTGFADLQRLLVKAERVR